MLFPSDTHQQEKPSLPAPPPPPPPTSDTPQSDSGRSFSSSSSNSVNPHWKEPPTQGPYTSRDGAPAPAPVGYAPPPPQESYPPPQGPPPSYGYAQTHSPSEPAYDQKGPTGPSHETYLSPPPGISSGPYTPPPPDAGSSSHDTSESSAMSLGAFFGNKGPPPMWHRQPAPTLPYNTFPPMSLISNGKDLSKGFPELPPPCQVNPHPFASHDVTQEDWKRFLVDVKKAGSLSPAQRIRSNAIPLVTGMSFVTGFFVTVAIEKKMKFKNRQAAGDLVDHWNHYFFGPRRMEVVLCQASERLSGKLGAAPIGDPNLQRMANGLRQRTGDTSSDDSSSSDDDHDHGHHHGHNQGFSDKHARRATRRERRSERREDRRARKAERRERKARGEFKEPYQLFITAI
ncbi:hypothetical protein L210DRAFT_957269 [Boletus edulis BED1]|uniref:Uncharacterized protein n=1 Tax=Boletus edulis BED1 TaxID=1328754 RepID=A0AAD4GGD1_BOLED|nr:hypothetical protein L210DRAFT_957269 [Boletus edulis BED1]